jgi:hypothetical protein
MFVALGRLTVVRLAQNSKAYWPIVLALPAMLLRALKFLKVEFKNPPP